MIRMAITLALLIMVSHTSIFPGHIFRGHPIADETKTKISNSTLSTFADRRRSHLKHLSSNGNWLIPIDSADNIFQIHIENLNLRCHIVKLRWTYGRLVWVHTSCHQSMPAWLEWKKKTGAEAEIALFKQGLFHESCLAVYKRVWDCWSSHVSPPPPLHASVHGWHALLYNITLEDPRFYSLRQRDLLIEAKILCFALSLMT